MDDGKRFSRFLLDGGFWFDEYIQPVWSISDKEDNNSIVSYLEFKDEYKDICDGLVDFLNKLVEE